jgi:hypothetical protein
MLKMLVIFKERFSQLGSTSKNSSLLEALALLNLTRGIMRGCFSTPLDHVLLVVYSVIIGIFERPQSPQSPNGNRLKQVTLAEAHSMSSYIAPPWPWILIASVPSLLPTFAKALVVLLVGYIHYQTIFTQTISDFAVDLTVGSVSNCGPIFDLGELCTVQFTSIHRINSALLQKTCPVDTQAIPESSDGLTNPHIFPLDFHPLSPARSSSSPGSYFATGCFAFFGVIAVVNVLNPGLTTPGMLLSEASLYRSC